MDPRHGGGQYHGQHFQGNHQQPPRYSQGNNSGGHYPWSQNGMSQFPTQAPPGVPPPPPNHPPPRSHGGGNSYYSNHQSQSDRMTPATPPRFPSGPPHPRHHQPYQNYPVYSGNSNNAQGSPYVQQQQQQMNNAIPPWGQYNQPQSYNNTSGSSTPQQSNVPGHVHNNPYNMYASAPSHGGSIPQLQQSQPQQQRETVAYPAPPPPPYYQMQSQQPNNYYYNSGSTTYPTGVPPPPLPPPPLPPQPAPKETSKRSDSPGESLPSTSRSGAGDAKRKAPSSEYASRDKKPNVSTTEEKEEKETKKAVPIMVGKRRGGRVLPTGVVKKQKVEDDNGKGKSDAWSQYMAEVRRYKDQSCTEERQNRPLVK